MWSITWLIPGFLQGVSGGRASLSSLRPCRLRFRFDMRPVLIKAVCKGLANLKLSDGDLLDGLLWVWLGDSEEELELYSYCISAPKEAFILKGGRLNLEERLFGVLLLFTIPPLLGLGIEEELEPLSVSGFAETLKFENVLEWDGFDWKVVLILDEEGDIGSLLRNRSHKRLFSGAVGVGEGEE